MNDVDEDENDFQKRAAILDRASSHKWSVKYTYLRNYFAAKWVGWLGWVLDIFTGIVGEVLIYKLTRQESADILGIDEFSSLTPTDLAIVILFGSLISSFYGPKLRSRKYYNAGQEHQELYDKIEDFIELDVANPDEDLDDLRKRLEELNERRHKLNQSTPQLGGIWYYSMRIWGWFVKKFSTIYHLIAPWKTTPEGILKTLDPRKEDPDSRDYPPAEERLRDKMGLSDDSQEE